MMTLDDFHAAAARFESEVGRDLQEFKAWMAQEWSSITGSTPAAPTPTPAPTTAPTLEPTLPPAASGETEQPASTTEPSVPTDTKPDAQQPDQNQSSEQPAQ